jgi:integrase
MASASRSRSADGRIGRYAARERAKELRRLVDQGRNPAGEKRERREAPTIEDLVRRYCTDHLPRKGAKNRSLPYMARTVKYREAWERKTLEEAARLLGRRTPVASVHSGDIQALHQTFTENHGPVLANRVLGICSKMFALSLLALPGENRPWRNAEQGNPARGIPRNFEEPRTRFFSQAELAAISDALNEYGKAPRAGSAADAIRLCMLCGCRPQEARLARWEQFEEPGVWVKPSSHMKVRREHWLPLSPAATELIERLRKRRKGDWVFPGRDPSEPVQQLLHCWNFVRQRAGLGMDARLYTLRHSFASVGASGGLSLYVIGKLLGHSNAATTQRYAHLADDPLKEAAHKIGAVIDGATNGNGGAEVVRIPRKG